MPLRSQETDASKALSERFKRAAINMRQRRPIGEVHSRPNRHGLNVIENTQERRGQAVPCGLAPSGVRQLKDERADNVGDDEDSVAFELTYSGHFLDKGLCFHAVSPLPSGDPDLKAGGECDVAKRASRKGIAKGDTDGP